MVLGCVCAVGAAQQQQDDAAVTGVVRDARGVPQMGALVQAFAGDRSAAGSTYTDLRGRYLIPNLVPGKYQIRATAALFLPAMKDNLRLHAGAQAIINLTLSTLFEPSEWLPAQRRQADEPGDDWKWTLRSAANRPILRMTDDDGTVVVFSTSATARPQVTSQGSVAVTSGDGGFGAGGVHHVFTLDRSSGTTDGSGSAGSGVILRANLSAPRTPYPVSPSVALSAGYQREMGFGGQVRGMMGYTSHPEIVSADGFVGMQTFVVETAQHLQIADTLTIDAGSVMKGVRTQMNALTAEPFVRVTMRPVGAVSLQYRMATARDLQGIEDMDAAEPAMPVGFLQGGKLRMEKGQHHEISVSAKTGKRVIAASVYSDNIAHAVVNGTGVPVNANGAVFEGMVADPTTESFRMLSGAYKSQGVNVSATQQLSPTMWAVMEYSTGKALAASYDDPMATAANMVASLHAVKAQSAVIAIRGRLVRSGTSMRGAYRWQPQGTMTAVNSYHAFSDQPYLSFYVRQPVRLGRMLPHGIEAIVDVTNLLAQGYRPFVSADGRTLFLAQSPRVLQAGLAFNF